MAVYYILTTFDSAVISEGSFFTFDCQYRPDKTDGNIIVGGAIHKRNLSIEPTPSDYDNPIPSRKKTDL
jgi:hypothetical protein